MLEITIPDIELFKNDTDEFLYIKGQTLRMEHSLVSLTKWESKWCKPFMSKEQKTREETTDYIRCMCITPINDDRLIDYLPAWAIKEVNTYIEAPMTATFFTEDKFKKQGPQRETITAEIIYYWMISQNVPFDPCQKWHLNRLLMLLRVCSFKNSPKKKMSQREIMSRNTALNAARKKSLNTTG